MEPGCLQHATYRSQAAPDPIVVLGLWDGPESYDRHWRSMLAPDPNAGQPGPADGPRKVIEFYRHRFYEYVDGAWQTTDGASRSESIRWT